MPTPGGMLKKGDEIIAQDGTRCIVTERLGNDRDYAVRIRKKDGTLFPSMKVENILTSAGYWIQHHGWRLAEKK